MPDQDLSLFKRIQNDDRLALNALFEIYYQKLCSFANTYLRHAPDAEECVSDVFVNLWKSRKQLVIDRSLKAYLYISVRNAALAFLRKKSPAYEKLEGLSDLMGETWGTEQAMMFAELEDIVRQVIDSLPSRCREVYVLIRVEGFSYREVSAMLEISEHTVENHLMKALSILRLAVRQYKQESSGHNTSLTF